jgi:hypothetical protein
LTQVAVQVALPEPVEPQVHFGAPSQISHDTLHEDEARHPLEPAFAR